MMVIVKTKIANNKIVYRSFRGIVFNIYSRVNKIFTNIIIMNDSFMLGLSIKGLDYTSIFEVE